MVENQIIQTKDELRMERAPIGRLFLRCSTPTVCGLLMASLQPIVDGLFVGNYIGAEGLAAVNMAMPVYVLVISLTLVFGIGAITLISTALGARDYSGANDAFRTAFICLAVTSVSISIGVLTNMDWVVNLLGATAELHPMVSDYLRGLAPCFMPMVLVFLCDFALKASGRPVTSMVLIAMIVVTNVVLDYLFVAHLGWGVWGAGYATGLTYVITSVVYMALMLRGGSNLTLREGRFRWRIIAPMAYNGASEGVADLSKAIIIFILNHTMVSIYGSQGVTALTTISYIQYMGITIYLGISDGIVPIISYNLGAKQPKRVRSVVRYGFMTNMLSGLGFFVLLFFFAEDIALLFVDKQQVTPQLFQIVNYGAKVIAFAFLFNGTNILISASFTAMRDATLSVLVAASRGAGVTGYGGYHVGFLP